MAITPGLRGTYVAALMRSNLAIDNRNTATYRLTIKRMDAPLEHPEFPAGAASNFFHDRVHVGTLLKARAPSGRGLNARFISNTASVTARSMPSNSCSKSWRKIIRNFICCGCFENCVECHRSARDEPDEGDSGEE